LRPVSIFASAGYDNHHAFGLGAVGGFPQGEEGIAAGLQLLLLLLWDLAFEGAGFCLAALG
jgi:hypothetical protein